MLGCWTALLLLWLGLARGAQPPGAFLTRTYTLTDGLRGTDVRALLLDQPGLLWVGTDLGLQRFDGAHFVAVPLGDPRRPAVLAMARAGDALVLQTEGGVRLVDGDRVEVIDELGCLSLQAGFATAPDGTIYLANEHGLYQVLPAERRLELLVAAEDGPPGWRPRAAAADATGVWVGSPQGLQRWEAGTLRAVDDHPVRAFLDDPDGLLVGREDGLHRIDGAPVLIYPPCFVTALSRLPDGRVAAGCGSGARIGRPGGAWEHLDERSGLPGPVALSVSADTDGNVWVGMLGQGLTRVSGLGARLWDRATGLPGGVPHLHPTVDGALLVGTLGAAWRVGPDLELHALPELADTTNEFMDLLQARDGAIWATHWGAIWRLLPAPGVLVRTITNPDGRLLEDTDGAIHKKDVEVGALLPVWPPDGAEITLPPDLGSARISADPDGALVAAGEAGIWRLTQRSFVREGDTPARCEGGELGFRPGERWLACQESVWRQADGGDWAPAYTATDALVRDLLVTPEDVWISTPLRLIRLAPTPLEIGATHGLPALSFARAGGYGVARLGPWLAAATDRGVLWLRPEAFEGALLPPEPRLTEVLVRGRPMRSDAPLEPADNFLQVRLSEDSLSDPSEISWRFRMNDDAWSEALSQDLLQLSGLPPGDHHLEVQARRGEGAWSEAIAVLDLTILAPWWARWDVRAALALGALGAATAIWQIRTRALREQLRRHQVYQALRQTFGTFVDAQVAEQALSGRLKKEGERREVTVLFADIRGFTPLSARLSPQDTVALLNAWLGAMVAEIEAERGVVNKFMGDAIFAVFGAPGDLPDHADRALRAAAAMIRATERLAVPLRARFGQAIRVGIGLNSGTVSTGLVGAVNRMEYGVYGEAVNIASRVEALTRTLEADVLLTDATARRLSQTFHLVHMGHHSVKGVEQAIEIWRLDVPPAGDAALQDWIQNAKKKAKGG